MPLAAKRSNRELGTDPNSRPTFEPFVWTMLPFSTTELVDEVHDLIMKLRSHI